MKVVYANFSKSYLQSSFHILCLFADNSSITDFMAESSALVPSPIKIKEWECYYIEQLLMEYACEENQSKQQYFVKNLICLFAICLD